MSSKNDDAAASNPAKRRLLPRVSGINGNRENRKTDNHSTTSSKTAYIVRTRGTPVTPLILVTISMPYVCPPNKPNAIKSLNGTQLEPLRALLAPLPERFITIIVAQSWAALDLSSVTPYSPSESSSGMNTARP